MKIQNNANIRANCLVLTLYLLLQLSACGGGGGSGSPGPPPAKDFALSVSPTSISFTAGSSGSISVEATAINGFSSSISVSVSGQQSGVSISPQSFTLTPGTPQSVTFTAALNTPTSSVTVAIAGSSGSLQHTAQLGLTVNGSYSGPPVRTRYVRTDATTGYFGWINQHWAIYDTNTSHFFVTDPFSNHVFVLDDASESEIATIGVPGAYGIDEAPDGSAIYVGTVIGDVYVIDPATMSVTTRYMSSQIGPNGFQSWVALPLANGQLALLGPPGGIPSIDYPTSYALWNPTTNSLSICDTVACGGGSISAFTTSVDRTELLTNGINEIDIATGQVISTNATAGRYQILTTADSKYVVAYGVNDNVFVYDTQTLAQVADFAVQGDGSGLALSADSSTLYTCGSSHGGFVYAYGLPNGNAVGWVPDIVVLPQEGGLVVGPLDVPYLLAGDGTGLFAGPLEEGVGFVDLSALQTGSGPTQFENGYLAPTTGPTSGGTITQNADPNPVGSLKSVYFGSQQATDLSLGPGFTINATSPTGSAGYVDVYTFTSDGGMQVLPEAFSYGPTILEVTPNMATHEGGGTGYIYGYGFGPNAKGIPTGLQITVGGSQASITSYNYFGYPNIGAPYPMEVFTYTIPPGGATGPVDVTVTTSSGSTTASGAMTYLPSTQEFPLAGSELAQGIYDPYLDVYFFTDVNQVQVFSRTQGKWLAPIAIPAPQGATQRLWGIALSPGGAYLAISDTSAGVIYLLNPTNPATVQTFSVQLPNGNSYAIGVAVSDSGFVYFAGNDGYYKLNTKTGAISNYLTGGTDQYVRAVITTDDGTVFFNTIGYLVSVNTGSDQLSQVGLLPLCCGNDELSLSNNNTQLTSSSYIYDVNMNAESFYALNDRENQYISYVYGAKVSADGRLIFQPSTNGIDVLDGNLGNLLQRVSLPFALSINYDAVVDDGKDNILIAITGSNGNGVAVVDLTSIPDPAVAPYTRETELRKHRSAKILGGQNRAPRYRAPEIRSQSLPGMRMIPHVTKSTHFNQSRGRSKTR
jgi:hypothetical protein